MADYQISLGLSGACKGSADEVNAVGCDNRPTHLQLRLRVGDDGSSALVAWCCACYQLEGGDDCTYVLEDDSNE